MSACPYCGRAGRFYRNEPTGYVAWHEWAEKMLRTHEQHPCPACGRLTVWRRKRGGEVSAPTVEDKLAVMAHKMTDDEIRAAKERIMGNPKRAGYQARHLNMGESLALAALMAEERARRFEDGLRDFRKRVVAASEFVFVRRCAVCGHEIQVAWGPETRSEARHQLIEHVSAHTDAEIRAWAMPHLAEADERQDG